MPEEPAAIEKLCRACSTVKPLPGGFHRHRRTKDGFVARCKVCVEQGRTILTKVTIPGDHARAGAAYSKLTPEKADRYIELRRQGMLRGEAAAAIGVSRETIRARRHSDPSFEARELDAEDDAIEPLERVAYQKALEGDKVLLLFLLQNMSGGSRRKFRYQDMRQVRKTVEHSGTVELNASSLNESIAVLTAKLEARAAIKSAAAGELAPPVIDAEVVDDE